MQKRLLILYGSETGQSEAISQQVYDQSLTQLKVVFDNLGLKVQRFCLDESEKQFTLESEETVIFVVSTTGEGEPPQNASKFYRNLRKRTLPKNLLSNLWYTLLGLGDTNYQNFANFDKRLKELSAKQFYRTGFADDAIGLEIEVEPWIENLWPSVLKHFNLFTKETLPTLPSLPSIVFNDIILKPQMDVKECPIMQLNESLTELSSLTLPSISNKFDSFKVNFHNLFPQKYEKTNEEFFYEKLKIMDSKIFDSSLIEAKVLTNNLSQEMASNDKIIIEAKFSVTDEHFVDYESGDSFGFIVGNCDEEILELLKILDLEEKQDFYCEIVSHKVFPKLKSLPQITKVYDLLKYYLDIRSVPSKSCLRHLAEFCSDLYHKRRLLELSCREGDQDYKRFVLNDVTILDILQVFDSCRTTLEVLLTYCSNFKPRYYSVSNWQNPNHRNQFRIVFSLMNCEPKLKRKGSQLMGVFTGTIFRLLKQFSDENVINRFSKLSLDSDIKSFKLFKRKNMSFKLPTDWEKPIIMVGLGTGVSPFLGFLETRQQILKERKELSSEWWLFYGCRHSDFDFIYKKELNNFLEENVLTRLSLCFSRQNNEKSEPKYVQHLILEESDNIFRLLDTLNAVVYVCGDIKKISKITETFIEVIQKCGDHSLESAKNYMDHLKTNQRYLLDIWI